MHLLASGPFASGPASRASSASSPAATACAIAPTEASPRPTSSTSSSPSPSTSSASAIKVPDRVKLRRRPAVSPRGEPGWQRSGHPSSLGRLRDQCVQDVHDVEHAGDAQEHEADDERGDDDLEEHLPEDGRDHRGNDDEDEHVSLPWRTTLDAATDGSRPSC